jgi:hypothetical protein
MATVINSFAITGVNGYQVEVETVTIYGQPSITIVGLGDTAFKESSQRLEASIGYAGYARGNSGRLRLPKFPKWGQSPATLIR